MARCFRPFFGAALGALLAASCLPRDDEQAGQGGGGAVSNGGGGDGGEQDGAGAEGPAGPGELSLVTWNLETFPLTDETSTKVEDMVLHWQPDLIAVQEVADEAAFHAFVAELDGYDAILNQDPYGFLRIAALYRPDRVVLEDAETLFPTSWWEFPRPPLKVHVRGPLSGGAETPSTVDFDLVVVHLKALGDSESQARRKAACAQLDAWVSGRLAAGEESSIVIAGDFNDELSDPPGANVYDVFLQQPELYSFLTQPSEQEGDATYIPFGSFIDHILVTNATLAELGGGAVEVLKPDATVGGYTVFVSDHRPVRARFAPGL